MSLANKLNITQIELQGGGYCVANHAQLGTPTKDTRILVRVDFNVPLDKKTGQVTDNRRIASTIPTLQHLLSLNPKRIVLVSHLGRPDGQRSPKASLQPVVPILSNLLGKEVQFVEDWGGDDTPAKLDAFPEGSVILLENVRFFIEEEGKGKGADGQKAKADKGKVTAFRAMLSQLCDLYVNDAFACSHRAHSSMVGVDVPLRAAGLLVKKELDYFDRALSNPQKPFLAILGGAKVADKIQVIKSLLDRVDEMIIGGGMCFTFKKMTQEMQIGDSLFDDAGAGIVAELMQKAEANGVKITLPIDFVCGDKFDADANTQVVSEKDGIPNGWMGLDIGPESQKLFKDAIDRAKTIVWNGPPGVFEMEKFEAGTRSVLENVAAATANGSITIIGGGDSAAACSKWDFDDKMSHISTGGGASLELLEGKELPGVAHLTEC